MDHSRLGPRRNKRDYSLNQRSAGKTVDERMLENELLEAGFLLSVFSLLSVKRSRANVFDLTELENKRLKRNKMLTDIILVAIVGVFLTIEQIVTP